MAAYAYKSVMFREDFAAAIPKYEAQENTAFKWEADYDGDGWYVVEFLLNEKDAEIARLHALLEPVQTAPQQEDDRG